MHVTSPQQNGASVEEIDHSLNRNLSYPNLFCPFDAKEAEFAVIKKKDQNVAVTNTAQLLSCANPYRKPCNCAKSHCLKLYCECFARGVACEGCNCTNCMNNLVHDDARRRAIKLTLERNPLAFHPKIGENDKKHSKGCNCKRSGCLKNYCECYEAKISCSDLCRCQGCRNSDNECNNEKLPHLGALAMMKTKNSQSQKKTLVPYDFAEQIVRLPNAVQAFRFYSNQPQSLPAYNECPSVAVIPNGFLSKEVTEAACSCMLAQLSEVKQRALSPVSQERAILEEFGKCLEQILESAAKLQCNASGWGESQYVPVEPARHPDLINLPSTMHGLNDMQLQLFDVHPVEQVRRGPDPYPLELSGPNPQNQCGSNSMEVMSCQDPLNIHLAESYNIADLAVHPSKNTQIIIPEAPEHASSTVHCFPIAYTSDWTKQQLVGMFDIPDDFSVSGIPAQNLQYSQVYQKLRQAELELQTMEPVASAEAMYSPGLQRLDYHTLQIPPPEINRYQQNELQEIASAPPEQTYYFGGESFEPQSVFGRPAVGHASSRMKEQVLANANTLGATCNIPAHVDEEAEVQTATEALLHASNSCMSNELQFAPQFDVAAGEELDIGEATPFESIRSTKYPEILKKLDYSDTHLTDECVQYKRESCCELNSVCDSDGVSANLPNFIKSQLRFYDL